LKILKPPVKVQTPGDQASGMFAPQLKCIQCTRY